MSPDSVPPVPSRPRRMLVTGGSGFIGTNLVAHYARLGATVRNVDPAPPRDSLQRHYWRPIDPLDPSQIRQVILEFAPTYVFHLGARTDLLGRCLSDYAYTVEATAYLLEALRDAPALERVLFASSRMVCDISHQPRHDHDYSAPNAYGESKVVTELLIRAANLRIPWLIVRPTSIWGPWFGIPYSTFFRAIARGTYVHIAGYRPLKSFGFVGNTVYQLDRLMEAAAEAVHGQTFYLADYSPIDVADMAERIRAALGAPRIRTLPYSLVRGPAIAGDLLHWAGWDNPPLTSFRLRNLVTDMVYDVSQLEALVGPLPSMLDDGIDKTVAWMREQRAL